MSTNIAVSEEVWTELNSRKQPGESFDDVLRRVLDLDKQNHAIELADDIGATSEIEEPNRAHVYEIDIPQTVDRNEARMAIEAAAEFVEEMDGASMREIVENVMPEHDLGYDIPDLEKGERYRGAWWRRVVKPGLEELDEVEKPKPGQSEWRWVEQER